MKTVIITGANSGLGYETAKKVAADHRYKIILACRNMEKAGAARDMIVSETGNENVAAMQIDTSSLKSVHAFAEKFISSGEKVDVLVNNAGISPMNHTGMTEDGFELVFATNYLGHFLLTHLLLPHMAEDARIYNVASDMHNPPGGITWPGVEALAHPKEDDRRKYSYSKLCMIYFTHGLDRRIREQHLHITVNSFNPGFMADTNFSGGGGKVRELMIKTTMPDRYGTLETSSDALAMLVTGDAFRKTGGDYYDRSTKTAKSSELSYNTENALELWDASERYCGLKMEATNFRKPDKEYVRGAHGVFPLAEQATPISAKELNSEFHENWETANQKWKYKRVTVTGVVRYKGPDIHNVPSFELSDSAEGACEVLVCLTGEKEYGDVQVGDTIVVQGNYLIESDQYGVCLKMSKVIMVSNSDLF